MSAPLQRTEANPSEPLEGQFTTPHPDLNELLSETYWMGKGPSMDGALLWLEALEKVLAALAESTPKTALSYFADDVEAAMAQESGWISVDERLPELGQSVALLNANGWENTGGDLEMNIRACGYLSEAGPLKFWSIRGQRATMLRAFTHWVALPPAPNQGEAS